MDACSLYPWVRCAPVGCELAAAAPGKTSWFSSGPAADQALLRRFPVRRSECSSENTAKHGQVVNSNEGGNSCGDPWSGWKFKCWTPFYFSATTVFTQGPGVSWKEKKRDLHLSQQEMVSTAQCGNPSPETKKDLALIGAKTFKSTEGVPWIGMKLSVS